MELQHIQFKIYSDTPEELYNDKTTILKTLHSWIQQKVFVDEILVDVADYSHVPAGPGILLMGHESIFAIEPGSEKRIGLRYTARSQIEGTNEQRIKLGLEKTIRACQMLQSAPGWASPVGFSSDEIRFAIDDRLLAPNSADTFARIKPELDTSLAQVAALKSPQTSYIAADSRERLQVKIQLAEALKI